MKVRWIWWFFVVLWCIQIYYFTALPVYNDEHTRGFLTRIFPYTHSEVLGMIDYAIRKAAHVTVFGILAVLVKMAIKHKRFCYYYAWLFTAFYAGTDEWHQSFVPGRTAAFTDVLFDSAGALVFLFCLFLLTKRKKRRARLRSLSSQS